MARDEKAREPVERRTYLKLAGIGVLSGMSVPVGSGGAAAAGTVGYGEDGYGITPYGGSSTDTALAVGTSGTTNVAPTAATLHGAISDMGGAASVTVRFEYRRTGTRNWVATARQSFGSAGAFSAEATGLEPATDYEFRVAASASDGDTAASSAAEFTTKRHTLVIDGSPSPNTANEYSWTVSGSVEKSGDLGSLQANDTIAGSSVSGEVVGGRDGYRFTGDVTDFEVNGESAVYLDGTRVDPANIGETTYPNEIVFDGSPEPGRTATYEATVSGKIRKSSTLGSIQSNDTISGSTASGDVYGGKDGYRFTGEVTELAVDGKMTLLFGDGNGSSTSTDSLPNTLVVDGTGAPNETCTYTVTVSGSVAKSDQLGSIQDNDTVSESTASGEVVGGKDGYRYSGDVTQIDVDGPVVFRLEDTDG